LDAEVTVEANVSGDLEVVGSPLVRELDAVFRRHGFDAGFVFTAFAADSEKWRFDSAVVIDDDIVCEHERHEVIGQALRWAAMSAQDMATGETTDE
jgi:hypothetical protein